MQKNNWIYSKKVKEHFFNPRNVLAGKPKKGEFNAYGKTGGIKCGDLMEVWLLIDEKTKKIKEMKWKTFGCASAIASTSVLSEMVKGKTLKQALAIKPQEIVRKLGGLPALKIHCSVMGDRALESAIANYQSKKNPKSK